MRLRPLPTTIVVLFAAGCVCAADAAEIIGAESLIPYNDRIEYAELIGLAPGMDETVQLNPPRFRWFYAPTIPELTYDWFGLYEFQFQIAPDPRFKKLVVDVRTDINFYNALAPLEVGTYFWRIGYINKLVRDKATGAWSAETEPGTWSPTRRFTIAPDAVVWDRSMLADPDFASKGHPRMLFNKNTLPKLRELVRTDPVAKRIFARMKSDADETIEAGWFKDFFTTDKRGVMNPPHRFDFHTNSMVGVVFVWLVTGDDKYAQVKDNFVRIASWPRGGLASPEQAGGQGEDSTQICEALALAYDWLHPKLTDQERQIMERALDWRCEYLLNEYCWRRHMWSSRLTKPRRAPTRLEDGKRVEAPGFVVNGGSVSVRCNNGNHCPEAWANGYSMSLAAYETSQAARDYFRVATNYYIGVGSNFGPNTGYGGGPGYGLSKLKWILHGMVYLHSVFPQLQIGKSPWLADQADHFNRLAPMGIQHTPWGTYNTNSEYYANGRTHCFRMAAYLTGQAHLLRPWRAQFDAEEDPWIIRPWIECALGSFCDAPKGGPESFVRAFPHGGYVMASSGTPSDKSGYDGGVGITFLARPQGAWYGCQNAFQIYAYGQDLNYGGGSTYPAAYPGRTISHNTVLIDGISQVRAYKEGLRYFARVFSFKTGDGYVYWAGDATNCHPQRGLDRSRDLQRLPVEPDLYSKADLSKHSKFHRHVLFMRDKYFVIFDDLATGPGRPARFSWLYHILPPCDLTFDQASFSITYTLGDVKTIIRQVATPDQLEFTDARGLEGYKNIITNKRYDEGRAYDRVRQRFAEEGKPMPICDHNLWITNRDPAERFHFLTVIYPVKRSSGDPEQAPDSDVGIDRLDDYTVRVRANGHQDVISFDPNTKHPATLIVDLPSLAPTPRPADWPAPVGSPHQKPK